ncbi:cannabidiolic acid synthase [Phtheirospermum japonicum]|uniref:Cannabidiolic acid synthase n=1 Tax=Phtheirospermum japonicum TaxID=374723 RepID=A0A830BJT4_9LAMI|nr:cannabidiolic acid synthase [Phtheirospermum japonicum]
MSTHSSTRHTNPSKYIHAQNSPSYSALLQSAEQNPRWINSTSLKPKLIITPYDASQIQAAILYYSIAHKSRILGFPGGLCPSVGVGGGAIARVPEDNLPFPHRKGNLFNIQYLVQWSVDGDEETRKHVDWDLDLGVNQKLNASYEEAIVWGRKYFKGNFERLAKVKKQVDPGNFFRNEQTIPLLFY